MSAETGSAIPIKNEELARQRKRAAVFLTSVSYEPKKELEQVRQDAAPKDSKKPEFLVSARSSGPKQMAILKLAKDLNGGDELMDEAINLSLVTVRTGLQIALHLADLFEKSTELSLLKERNNNNMLTAAQKEEWRLLMETQSAIVLFVTAYYVSWKLTEINNGSNGWASAFTGIPEALPFSGQTLALSAAMYHWGSYLKEVQSPQEFLKITESFFRSMFEDVKAQAAANVFKRADEFVRRTYLLEGTKFSINGFRGDILGATVVEFPRVEQKHIMGNFEAKRLAMRESQSVMCYDEVAQKNPMVELGAFAGLGVFQGWAGTGKTMLLQNIQTLVQDYCKAYKRPFILHPLPTDIVSTFQGGSAEKYAAWWSRLYNPEAIIVAPVDDAEAIYLDRRSQSSSEGSKGIVMAHLRLTEGSTALTRGNVLQPHATNNADMIDAPVFSRYRYRAVVPGAETRHDYLDQFRDWGDTANKKIERPLIDLVFPDDYVFLSDQKASLAEKKERKREGLVQFKNVELVKVWDQIRVKNLAINSYDLYATLFELLHKRFEQFTSRDVRNITINIMSRLFGFDFDQKWLEDRDAFFAKDYATKKQMLIDRAVESQGGLSIAEVILEETVNYVETTIAMLDSGRQYRVRQMASDLLERKEAEALATQTLQSGQTRL